jgi:hypothetical protein
VYLEELTDTVPESDNTTQTDAFMDRPPTPLFVPQKTGMDAATQIEKGTFRGLANVLHRKSAKIHMAGSRQQAWQDHGQHVYNLSCSLC